MRSHFIPLSWDGPVSVVLVLVVLAQALAGCGSPGSAEAPPSSEGARTSDERNSLEVRIQRADGGSLSGDFEIWALEEGSFDPRALVVAGRVTGDRIESTRRAASWNGVAPDGSVAIPRRESADVLLMARRGDWYGEAEVGAGSAGPVELFVRERERLVARVLDGEGRPVEGAPVGLAARDDRGGLRLLPITARTDGQGLAVLHGGSRGDRGAPTLEAVLRAATRERVAQPIGPDLEAVLQFPGEFAALEVHVIQPSGKGEGQGAGDGLEGVVQVFAASEGSRSSRALSSPVKGGATEALLVEVGADLRAIVALSDPEDPLSFVGRAVVELEPLQGHGAARRSLDLSGWVELAGVAEADGKALESGSPLDLALAPALRATMRVVCGEGGRFRWYVPAEALAESNALRATAGLRRGEVPLDPSASGPRQGLALELR